MNDITRLNEVTDAAHAALEHIRKRKAELKESGNYTDAYISKEMAVMGHQWIEQRAKLTSEIVNPIDERFKAIDPNPQLPERTAIHVEASQHYAALQSDKRQEAIARAVVGKDDLLAVALLTGRDPITDITREQLLRRVTPPDLAEKQAERVDMLRRVRDVRVTLNDITREISGETS